MQNKGYSSDKSASRAKRTIGRETIDDMAAEDPDGSKGKSGIKNVANPWGFMDTGEVKYGEGEFHEGGGKK